MFDSRYNIGNKHMEQGVDSCTKWQKGLKNYCVKEVKRNQNASSSQRHYNMSTKRITSLG